MKIFGVTILFLVFLSTGFVQNANSLDCTETEVITLLPDEFMAKMQEEQNLIIFDVRDLKMFAKYKIEGSIYAPKREVLYSVLDTLDKETPVFVYCQIGFSSNIASKLVAKKGFTTVYNLKNGLKSWKKEGYPTVKISRNERKKYE